MWGLRLAYDPELDLLYVGTGKCTPAGIARFAVPPAVTISTCPRLSLCVPVLANKCQRAVRQLPVIPGTSPRTRRMILADLVIEGQKRKVLMQAPKNGFFYVIDRQTGKLISAEAYVPVTWAKIIDKLHGPPIEDPAARYKDSLALVKPQGAWRT